MKKAKVILTIVAVLAVVGGALAFKASRSGIGKLFYTSNQYFSAGTIYTRPNLATFCAPTTANVFWSLEGTPTTSSFKTTFLPTTVITLHQVGVPANTITIPSYTCVLTTLPTTNVEQ